jgi:hypothetical protein
MRPTTHTVASNTRFRCGAPVRGDASAVSRSTRPAHTASADNQSRPDGQRRCSPDASDSTNSSCAAIIGWTAATDPTLSAAAWVPTPPRFVSQPASHVLLRTRRPTNRLTPDASLSDATSKPTMRAARCCRNADNANRNAAARANAATAIMRSSRASLTGLSTPR